MARLYAHRGAAVEFPENTMPAFRRAMEVGADALETDVHRSRDGHIIVSHDPNAKRMTGRELEFRNSSLAEIRELDAGASFEDENGERPHAGKGIGIPTFAELLEEFPDIVINVDLKQSEPPIVHDMLALLRRHNAEERVQLASFSWRTLLAVRRAGFCGRTAFSAPEAAIAQLLPVRWVDRLPYFGDIAQLPTAREFEEQSSEELVARLDQIGRLVSFIPGLRDLGERIDHLFRNEGELIERLHQAGKVVDFWTVNDPDEAKRLVALGADGIMTDDPTRIAKALGKSKALAR